MKLETAMASSVMEQDRCFGSMLEKNSSFERDLVLESSETGSFTCYLEITRGPRFSMLRETMGPSYSRLSREFLFYTSAAASFDTVSGRGPGGDIEGEIETVNYLWRWKVQRVSD